MVDNWDIEQITFAHGTSPFDRQRMEQLGLGHKTPGEVYMDCWRQGLARLVK